MQFSGITLIAGPQAYLSHIKTIDRDYFFDLIVNNPSKIGVDYEDMAFFMKEVAKEPGFSRETGEALQPLLKKHAESFVNYVRQCIKQGISKNKKPNLLIEIAKP